MAIYKHEILGHLAPGPDGRTVFSGRAGRLDIDGNALDPAEGNPAVPPEQSIPSCDPAYYTPSGISSPLEIYGGLQTVLIVLCLRGSHNRLRTAPPARVLIPYGRFDQ